jgi:3'-phosphoadenosine 5'-phosphosulfate sulfotransferase (PAPS reductase)/FAD synthetase/ferredoxin
MYKITWDKETGGVQLHSRIVEGTLGISPRPVFWEELDLLKLNELGWIYPHTEEPLLWALNKQYWYRGELMFEAKGANIYDDATIDFEVGKERMTLEPVNVEAMLEKNKEYMFLLESEAIEFIHETYEQYSGARKSVNSVAANQLDYEALAARAEKKSKTKMAIVKEDCDSFDIVPLTEAEKQGKKVYHTTKIDKFIASFSGGKDSQVVLDLCTRAIPSTDFQVIYSDTGYELPSSLDLYKNIQQHYHAIFPDLKFSLAKNHESVTNYWDKIGTPSDKHRWCCAIMKTAPLYRSLKVDGNKQAKALAFEGVRSEESHARSDYQRIGKGVKHDTVINARPILNWNTSEVFMYLFKHKLPINAAYRLGKPRVGCLICPFSSPWDDMIVNKMYPGQLYPFLSRLVRWSRDRHIPNLNEYIKEHKWKLRASGNNVGSKTKVIFLKQFPTFEAKVTNAHLSIETWLPVLCDYTINREGKRLFGELRYEKSIYSFDIVENDDNNYTFIVHEITDAQLVSKLKRIIYKSAYCIQCEGCEVECPTGALSVYPKVNVDKYKCIHCHKCINFHDNGCIVANSLIMNTQTKVNGGGISRIGTFGIHEEWFQEFVADPIEFWVDNSLGNKQLQSFKAWLIDADIIDSKKSLTDFGNFCVEHFEDEHDLIWELIWTNFAYGSTLIHWFINTIKPGQIFNKAMLDELALNSFEGTRNTITYAIGGFMQVFNYSPIGSFLKQGVDVDGKSLMRSPYTDLSAPAFAYSIYKYAEKNSIRTLRVADFYKEECETGPAKEFAIPKSEFEKLLHQLNSESNQVLIAHLNMGLDSVILREDLNSMEVLNQLVI